MTTTRGRRWARVAIFLAACELAPRPFAQEPQPDAIESSGVIQLTDEKVLDLVDLRGEIVLQAGSEREIQFTSVKAADRATALPVAVWYDEKGVTLRPPDGQADPKRAIEITVPPGFEVRAETEDATIVGSGLNGNLAIKGIRVAVTIRGLSGNLSVDTSAAKVLVDSIVGSVSIRARDAETVVKGIQGLLTVRAVHGTLTVGTARGFVADLDTVTSKVDVVADPVQIRARGGALTLSSARGGGGITLAGTKLKLDHCVGAFAIETDASVAFNDCKADLKFEGEAARLTGERNMGSVEVRARGTGVALSNLSGPTRVDGENLDVKLENLSGDLVVKTAASEIFASIISGAVDVDNDGGGISLRQVQGDVKVKSRRGAVTVAQATGPIQVEADGGNVDITWLTMSFKGKSDIRSADGDVVVHIPRQGGVRIEAESQYAEVESHFPEVVVTPDRHKAQGLVGYPGQAIINIAAEGVVRLVSDDAAPETPAENDNQ